MQTLRLYIIVHIIRLYLYSNYLIYVNILQIKNLIDVRLSLIIAIRRTLRIKMNFNKLNLPFST